jgi:hypothetical protein
MRALTVGIAMIAVLLAGCSDTSSDGGTPTPGVLTTPDDTGEPATEPTNPESTQAQQQQPSIELASAPIGGNVDVDGIKQCAEVNWLGRNPIPDGTTIRLGPPGLDPGGVFDWDQSSCAGDLRPCTDVMWQSSSFQACYVGVRQIANGSKDVSLIIPVAATCASQEDCDSLANGTGGSQITFSPEILDTPTTETSAGG